jgi:tol-pal system protein YbgF
MLMQRRSTPFQFALPTIALAALLMPALPSHAQSTKDRITDLTDQVKLLTDMTQRLQSTVDSKFGVLQHLVEQSTDSVNQMSATINSMQQKMTAANESTGGKVDAVSGQVQSLNDSIDELKSRLGKLDKQMQDIQAQLQNVQSQPGAAPQGGQPNQPGNQPGPQDGGGGNAGAQQPAAANQAPPLQETYQSGLRDYNAAHYDVAISEFGDVLNYYPHDDLAGNAQFYLGEIAYRQQKYKDAIKAYNAVLENFSGNPKAPAAQLRKGLALIQLNQKDAGAHELRSLIQRYPQTPEAMQARTKLNAMGIRVVPR